MSLHSSRSGHHCECAIAGQWHSYTCVEGQQSKHALVCCMPTSVCISSLLCLGLHHTWRLRKAPCRHQCQHTLLQQTRCVHDVNGQSHDNAQVYPPACREVSQCGKTAGRCTIRENITCMPVSTWLQIKLVAFAKQQSCDKHAHVCIKQALAQSLNNALVRCVMGQPQQAGVYMSARCCSSYQC